MTPRAWTAKDERQYEHVRDSERRRGVAKKRATEIAARTVNKTRRKQGRTRNRTTQGTGNPNSALELRTRRELYNLAKARGIAGRSRMSKAQLIAALR